MGSTPFPLDSSCGILSPILSPFVRGVNAEKTTSSARERWSRETPAVATPCSTVFSSLSPLLSFGGVNACDDYISISIGEFRRMDLVLYTFLKRTRISQTIINSSGMADRKIIFGPPTKA
jgi:hypothetical protein